MDEVKNQINGLEHKEAKTTMQNKKNKESTKMRTVLAASGTTSRGPTFAS